MGVGVQGESPFKIMAIILKVKVAQVAIILNVKKVKGSSSRHFLNFELQLPASSESHEGFGLPGGAWK